MTVNSGEVAIIGANRIGSMCAWSLAAHGIGTHIRLIDTDRPRVSAQATDLCDAASPLNNSVQIVPGSYADCKNAQVAVICLDTHAPRCSRSSHLKQTAALVAHAAQELRTCGFGGVAILMCAFNDVMTRYFCEVSGLPAQKVLGGEAILFGLRLQRLLAEAFEVECKDVEIAALGESGESQTVAWSSAKIAGRPMLECMAQAPETLGRIDLCAIAANARNLGNVIQDGKGHEEFGLTSAACLAARAVLNDLQIVLPVSTALEGAYGQSDLFAVTPAVIGAQGVQRIVELPLESGEQAEFAASCQVIRNLYDELSLERVSH